MRKCLATSAVWDAAGETCVSQSTTQNTEVGLPCLGGEEIKKENKKIK